MHFKEQKKPILNIYVFFYKFSFTCLNFQNGFSIGDDIDPVDDNTNSLAIGILAFHSSEIQWLCLMKLPSEILKFLEYEIPSSFCHTYSKNMANFEAFH